MGLKKGIQIIEGAVFKTFSNTILSDGYGDGNGSMSYTFSELSSISKVYVYGRIAAGSYNYCYYGNNKDGILSDTNYRILECEITGNTVKLTSKNSETDTILTNSFKDNTNNKFVIIAEG